MTARVSMAAPRAPELLASLFTLGLRDHHRVLDFGCGSLRLGRLLIPFLQPDRYFGIEPETWLVDDGLDRELGRGISTRAAPDGRVWTR